MLHPRGKPRKILQCGVYNLFNYAVGHQLAGENQAITRTRLAWVAHSLQLAMSKYGICQWLITAISYSGFFVWVHDQQLETNNTSELASTQNPPSVYHCCQRCSQLHEKLQGDKQPSWMTSQRFQQPWFTDMLIKMMQVICLLSSLAFFSNQLQNGTHIRKVSESHVDKEQHPGISHSC